MGFYSRVLGRALVLAAGLILGVVGFDESAFADQASALAQCQAQLQASESAYLSSCHTGACAATGGACVSIKNTNVPGEVCYGSTFREIASDGSNFGWGGTITNGNSSNPNDYPWCFTPVCTAGGNAPDSQFAGAPMTDGQTVCDNGCEATFHCQNSACYIALGGASTGFNFGTATETGNLCGTNGASENPNHNPPPCQGDVCFTPSPPQMCDSEGACAPIPGPNCGTNNTSALCNGNPPPPPPNPPAGNNCPDTTSSWTYSGNAGTGNFSSDNFPNCPPPNNSCPPGTTDVDGTCVSKCPPGQRQTDQGCVNQCQQGYTDVGGQCVPQCQGNTHLSGTTCVVNCPTGQTPSADGTYCVNNCPATTTVQPDGSCKTVCGPGTVSSNGQCVVSCPTNTAADSRGVCEPTNCGTGKVVTNGQCATQCPQGQQVQGNNCVPGDTASGGVDCSAPPTCSGDQTLCNIDYQTWADRCASQGKVTGGTTCDAPPVCTGNELECAQLYQQWKSNCPGQLPGGDPQPYLDQQPTSGATAFDSGGTTPAFDSSGFLGGSGSCVNFDPITMSFGGVSQVFDLNNTSWCLVSQLLSALVLMVAYFRAAQIVMRG